MLKSSSQRGDTLVEVLIAVTIFSAVAVGAITVMSRGISVAQSSLELNLVRNQIDTQAELLRHINSVELGSTHNSASGTESTWKKAISKTVAEASQYDDINSFSQCKVAGVDGVGVPSHAFFIDPSSGRVVRGQDKFSVPGTFAQVYPGGKSEMVWIEAVYDENKQNQDRLTTSKYYDFHIRACWDSPGSGGVMKIGTIVRLYAPN
ncbi:type II secretion system protein [Candidatus Saccharibacteria bacterium]|jgi:prepilin-type N-terminal cleavage/methylation domain-containing protein|nr:type II secretion system protein [Candidatus Saccharibacteria bacterium]